MTSARCSNRTNGEAMTTRGNRILGMMMLFGILAATLAGSWEYASPLTIAAIGVGGFAGEAWDQWRRANS